MFALSQYLFSRHSPEISRHTSVPRHTLWEPLLYMKTCIGHAVVQLVEVLCFMLEGHGFDSRWCHWNFHWLIPSGCAIALGLTQPLTDMSTRNIFYRVKVAGAKDWQPCNLHMLIVLKSRSLNFLEPLGPLKACTGIDIRLLIWNMWVLRFLCQCCWMFSLLRCFAVTFQSYHSVLIFRVC